VIAPLLGWALAHILGGPQAYEAQCLYWTEAGASYSGPCRVSIASNQGQFVQTVTMGKVVIRLVETKRQGQWATYTIDGRPGVRYEVNREEYRYSTLALDMTLDILER